MHRFLLTFLFFLSCGFNSGCTEILKNEYSHLNGVLNKEASVNAFQCSDDEECETLIPGSICNNSLCKCPESKVLSSDASKCLPQAKEFGSPCEDNVQCSSLLSSGGVCENKKCSCKSGHHYLRGDCWKNVDLNGKCVRDEQCFSSHQYVGLECKEGKCKCRDKYYTRLGSGCRRIRELGESCNLDEDCRESTCGTDMKCGSKETFSSFSKTKRVQIWRYLDCPKGTFEYDGECVLELGMNCTKNEECSHIDYALCLDNSRCACEPAAFAPREDNRKCLRVTRGRVDDISRSSCQGDSQCEVFGPNSHCDKKRCACKDGSYFESNKKFCWKIKSLGESCNCDTDCHSSATHAECKTTPTGKQCVCQNGYHQKDSECLPDAVGVGDPCEKDEDCLFPFSFCNDTNVCACKKHYYYEEGICKPGVGTLCVKDEDCANLKNTECKVGDIPLKKCLCLENHTHTNDYKYCLPVARHKETCEESFQCEFHIGSLGECKNKTCECRKGAHYSYGKCHKSKFIGESCSKRQDCFPGNDTNSVICQKGFCRCNYDYELDESKVCVKTNSGTHLKSLTTLLTSLLLFLAIR